MNKEFYIYVSSDCVQQVVAPFSIAVPVSGNGNNRHLMVCKPYSCCNRQSPSVKPIEGIALHVVGQLGSLSNPRYDSKLVRLNVKFYKGLFEGI
ncbi:hypothetical protein BMS3Bbin07_00220 [bacterium BMS3Bbin07]|nr:hypothetical protein BMS3Bbin07_00220 [bacterium BMS3Bbin07]